LDARQVYELAQKGDVETLMTLLGPVDEDPFAASYYLVAEVPRVKTFDDLTADIFWGGRDTCPYLSQTLYFGKQTATGLHSQKFIPCYS